MMVNVQQGFFSLIIIGTIVVTGCLFYTNYNVNYETGTFPETVTNFAILNTEYDDMNSAGPPFIGKRFRFYLSTRRFGGHTAFDIAQFDLGFSFNQHDGKFGFYDALTEVRCVSPINSSGNEFGPLLLSFERDVHFKKESFTKVTHYSDFKWSDESRKYFLLFASNNNAAGDLDIMGTTQFFLHETGGERAQTPPPFSLFRLAALNSTSDDAYVSFGPDSNVFFCSNRQGNFDIFMLDYSGKLPHGDDIISFLSDSINAGYVSSVPVLNTPSDEKCPFVYGNTLFFVSDRPGGKGGYDIWTSLYADGTWSEPQNAGAAINSTGDEYRPIMTSCQGFENNLLIFSSDRPGGKGGFDLYYTGFASE